ncbi:MAG: FtsX-like permease family protein, partial [Asticcacaulis sp.]|nr:FtsX-like permease family protein [Asticcacaulis sp.]
MIISLLNYVNLAAARAGLRIQEVVLRRAAGAAVHDLRLQFLVEALMLSLVGSLIGFSLVELFLSPVNRVGGLRLHLDYVGDGPFIACLMGTILASGMIAGLYPAHLLSQLAPAGYRPLPNRFQLFSRRGVRQGLVVLQFAVVSAAFVVLAGFAAQIRHVESSELGFPRQGILTTWSTNSPYVSEERLNRIMAAWRAVPDVRTVAVGFPPGEYFTGRMRMPVDLIGPGGRQVGFDFRQYDAKLGQAMDTRLLAGRAIDEGDRVTAELQPLGKYEATARININVTALRQLGLASPDAAIGRRLRFLNATLIIVGVVADQRLGAPTEPIAPTLYVNRFSRSSQFATFVRFDKVSDDVMAARLKSAWRKVAPDMPLDLDSMSKALDSYYTADRQMTNLFAVGVVVAALIGAIGLYGMAAFSTSARAREIALRKMMGATRWQVMRLLVFQFLKPVLIANLIAWPVGGFILWRWLSQFDDRVPLS